MASIQSIGVLSSGGDAPGMNAAIRAVTRAAIYYQYKVYGIKRGYEGLVEGDISPLDTHDVSNIIQRGGSMLKSGRSRQFTTEAGMRKACENLKSKGIDALIVIGGEGTFRGAKEFSEKYDLPVIGIPATIDNDLYGTDYAIGYDTAINTALDAIDKIRDTADAHDRLFFIEVMGRDAGFIALRSGIAGGAEDILVPELKTDIDNLIQKLQDFHKRKKTSMIVIVAEGDDSGGAFDVAERVKEKFGYYDIRVVVLGHMQRGGSPTCMDRVLASRLGVAAVEALRDGKKNVMVGSCHKDISYIPFDQSIKHHTALDNNLLRIASILTT